MPLLGRHAGRFPERLVAVVGGPDSGKTCYLHMAVHQIVHGNGQLLPIRGSIDDPQQEKVFEDAWGLLNAGVVAAGKTKDVTHAYILHTRVQDRRCQLYLYDAPGEEFSSLSSMSRQQYFPLIEGFILLVDPVSFAANDGLVPSHRRTSISDVVSSTLGTCLSGMEPGPDNKFAARVAVVISKADLPAVRSQIDVPGSCEETSARCGAVLHSWGASGALRALETHFASVEYFACSALGREAGTLSGEPLRGQGLLEPLCWILNARKNHPADPRLTHSGEQG